MKICIPSLNRGNLISTHKVFPNNLSDLILFIHEFDVHNYDHLLLEKQVSSKGVKSVSSDRNRILDYARSKGLEKIGMIDDDIISLNKRNENKYNWFEGRKTTTAGYDAIVANNEFLNRVSLLLDTFAIYSIPMQGFARLTDLSKYRDNLVINKLMPFTFVFMNLSKIDVSIKYDEDLKLYEDQDFALNVVKSGQNVVSDFTYSFTARHKIEGGCFESWSKYSKEEIYQMLVKKHGAEYVRKYTNKRYNNLVFKPLKNK